MKTCDLKAKQRCRSPDLRAEKLRIELEAPARTFMFLQPGISSLARVSTFWSIPRFDTCILRPIGARRMIFRCYILIHLDPPWSILMDCIVLDWLNMIQAREAQTLATAKAASPTWMLCNKHISCSTIPAVGKKGCAHEIHPISNENPFSMPKRIQENGWGKLSG